MRRFSDINYYAVLGVSALASRDEIRAAYRALVRTAHPDAGGDPEEFSKIAEAWEVLGNDDDREYYDADRKLKARATRPYTRMREGAGFDGHGERGERVATATPDDGLSDSERWMRNKRRL